MRRIAVVAPSRRWYDVLAAVADSGVVEPDLPSGQGAPVPGTVDSAPDAELERVSAGALRRDPVTAFTGWATAGAIEPLARRLAPLGGSVVELPLPQGVDVPTALAPHRSSRTMRPLVDTYATVPYRDLDPLWFATVAYVVMFGMMFGDVGDGLLLVGGALLMRRSRSHRLDGVRRAWPLVLVLGFSACGFGLLYGEAFGPTGAVPTLWFAPLDDPVRLLVAGIAVGAVLLAAAYTLGIVNRWREGGAAAALWAPSGVAGGVLLAGFALVVAGLAWSTAALWVGGLVLAVLGLAMAAVGLRSQAAPGALGVVQAGVETFDLPIRLGSNVVSFARLAAFGLMHAALAFVIWDAASSLWGSGFAAALAAVAVFLLGHAIAFALEALVAGVQALRLEYYELFSRVFVSEGRPFQPWHVATGKRP